jgi:hypothetical protein
MRLPSVSLSRYIGTRFLANVRNDRILCGIRGSSGDLFNESPLLPLHITIINVVIPNESRIAGEVRNRVSRMADEFTEGNL